MNYHFSFLVIGILFFSIDIRAQSIISGSLIDDSMSPIEGATIMYDTKMTFSDKEGAFDISSQYDTIPLTITIIGYKTLDTFAISSQFNIFTLSQEVITLSEIKVTNQYIPIRISDYSIVDFIFVDSFILTLEYVNSFQPYRISKRDLNLNIIESINCPEKKDFRLRLSCTNFPLLIHKKEVYSIIDTPFSVQKIMYSYYQEQLETCIHSFSNGYIFQEQQANGLLTQFYQKKRTHSAPQLLYTIGDRQHIQAYYNDLGEIKKGEQISTMELEGPKAVELNKEFREYQLLSDFYKSQLYTNSFNNYTFSIDSCFLIMNHTNNQKVLLCEHNKRFLNPMQYIHNPRWTGKLLQDQGTNTVYNVFKHVPKGYLFAQYQLASDSFTPVYLTDQRFDLSQCQIHNGFLYVVEKNNKTQTYELVKMKLSKIAIE